MPPLLTKRYSYGDNYITFGSLNSAKGGAYLLTPTNTTDDSGQLSPSTDPVYQGVVYAPSTIGFILIRILVKNRQDDLKQAQALQREFGTELISRNSAPMGPALNVDLFTNSSGSQAAHILSLATRFEQTTPRQNNGNNITDVPKAAKEQLSRAGIGTNGQYTSPECVDVAEAAKQASRAIQ